MLRARLWRLLASSPAHAPWRRAPEHFERGCHRVPRLRAIPKKVVDSLRTGGRALRLDVACSHMPSLYLWLQTRAGISFEETDRLVSEERIRVTEAPRNSSSEEESENMDTIAAEKVVVVRDHRELMKQETWDAMAKKRTEILREDGLWVPALERRLHRQYAILHKGTGMNLSYNVANSGSFLHSVPPPTHGVWTPLVVPGYLNRETSARHVQGFVLLTTDLTLPRLLSVSAFGSGGTFRLDLIPGTPPSVRSALVEWLQSLPAQDHKLSGEFSPYKVTQSSSMEAGSATDGSSLYLTTALLSTWMISKLLHFSVERITCISFQGIALPGDLAPNNYRLMNGEERHQLERAVRRNQAQYISLLCREY